MRRPLVLALVLLAVSANAATAGAASAVAPPWKNCTQVNKKYPHGVGKVGAHDTSSDTPVTTFKKSNTLYRTAMSNN